jgi:hypothetical protein
MRSGRSLLMTIRNLRIASKFWQKRAASTVSGVSTAFCDLIFISGIKIMRNLISGGKKET